MKQREHAHWLNQIKSIFAIGSALDFALSETRARANNNITPIRADRHHLYIHTHTRALTHTIGIFLHQLSIKRVLPSLCTPFDRINRLTLTE